MSEIKNDDLIVINTEQQTQVVEKKAPIFQLVHETHPILRKIMPVFDFDNPPVDPTEFASSMVETCKLHHGIGLSANQCGFEYRMFVMGANDNYVAFFNPKITEQTEQMQHGLEGCLSFPFLGLRVTRPESVRVEYQDFKGNWKTAEYSGLSARCFQHELDHMNGIVYTNKVKPMALQSGMQKRNKILKKLKLK
jgi:peptide deformylase